MRKIDGFSSATSAWSVSKFKRRPHIELAGDHTVGFSVPATIFDSAAPEATVRPSTNTVLAPTFGCDAL